MYEPMELIQKSLDGLSGLSGVNTLSEASTAWLSKDLQTYFENSDRLIDFVTSDEFLAQEVEEFSEDLSEQRLLEDFNQQVGEKLPALVKLLGASEADIRSGKVSLITECRDYLLAPVIFDKWAHHKQVYAPDADFAIALMHTEHLEFSRDMLEHLPFNIFYLDMSALKLADVHGAFVNVAVHGNWGFVTIFLLTHDLVYFSHYMQVLFDKDGKAYFERGDITEAAPFVLDSVREDSDSGIKSAYDFSRQDVVTLIMQTLAYIASDEPQIEESSRTKNTYKPHKHGDVVKNKWSELQIFEMGYAYGAAFRRKLKKAEAEVGTSVDMINSAEEKKRKVTRPHIRCAHWQRFRYGEGHKLLSAPRWMKPMFVGFGNIEEEEDAKVATIHIVRGKKEPK